MPARLSSHGFTKLGVRKEVSQGCGPQGQPFLEMQAFRGCRNGPVPTAANLGGHLSNLSAFFQVETRIQGVQIMALPNWCHAVVEALVLCNACPEPSAPEPTAMKVRIDIILLNV